MPSISALPTDFEITNDTLIIEDNVNKMPNIKIVGRIDNLHCSLNKPFTGYIAIRNSDWKIQSVDIQLSRVECFNDALNKPQKKVTEVQNVQIIDGNVMKDVDIPLTMIFPKFFSCTSFEFQAISVQFEINIVVSFMTGYQISKNFSLKLLRC